MKLNGLTRYIGHTTVSGILLLMGGCATRVDESGNYTIFGNGAAPGSDLCRARKSVDDLAFYNYLAARPDHNLTVEDAVQLALLHNLDLWVAREEIEIQDEIKNRTKQKMLPGLMLSGEESGRNRENVTSSSNYYTHQTTVPTSYSRERHQESFRLEAAWNLLDFGVSYVNSLQQENRTQIQEQVYRRTRQKVVLEVKAAYWTAVAADEVAKVANSIAVVIENQRDVLQRHIQDGNISKEDGLQQDLELLNRLKLMNHYERDAQSARAELARLIGLPVGMKVNLIPFNYETMDVSEALPGVEELCQYAIMNRPELFCKDLEEAISYEDARAALLKTLPSPSMFLGFNYDADSHLLFENWTTYGLRASWNLFSIPGSLKDRKIGKMNAEVKQRERMALTVSVMTQVNIAYLQYQEALRGFRMSDDIHQRRLALLDAFIDGAKQGTHTDAEVVNQKLLFLQDRAAYLMAIADVATARVRIYSAMGADPDENGNYLFDQMKPHASVLLLENGYPLESVKWSGETEAESGE